MNKILGIDATNIRSSGGANHLIELLKNETLAKKKFSKIIVWGNSDLIKNITSSNFIETKTINTNSILFKLFWYFIKISQEIKKNNCSIILCLGGIYFSQKPYVCLVQNLLPYFDTELKKYNLKFKIKNFFLKKIYNYTFARAKHLIFLSELSKKIIKKNLNYLPQNNIISHGVDRNKFIFKKKKLNKKKIIILYNSAIEPYKNQFNLILAIHKLIIRKYKIKLILLGNKNMHYHKKLLKLINILCLKNYIIFKYEKNFKKIVNIYNIADIKVYASTCEAFGMSLLEAIASGTPIVASNFSGNREILKKNSIYFDSENVDSIARGIEKMILSDRLRKKLSKNAFNSIKNKFIWKKTAKLTFDTIYKNCK